MGDDAVLFRDLAPALTSVLRVAHGQHETIRAAGPRHVILENNLTRKGVWATDPSRGEAQLEIRFTAEDVVGKLLIESSLGRLSTNEMELVSWVMAQWERQETPESPWVHCSLKSLADAFGVKWNGQRAVFIKEALERLHGVRLKAEVWNHKEQQLKTELFGIFDRVSIVERTKGYSGRWTVAADNAPVKIKLGDFLHQQLKLGQFHRYSWHILRGKLTTPLAKRLYVFLDAQRGTATDGGWVYEVSVDRDLFASLGVRDRNVARVRQRLRQACEQIVRSDRTYSELRMRESGGGGWVLRRVKNREREGTNLATGSGCRP